MNWPDNVNSVIMAVIATEGDFVNDPADAGGATRYGITLATLSAWRGKQCTVADVQSLAIDEAVSIYRSEYVKRPGFEQITNLRLLYILVDTAVLFGQGRAVKMLQTAVGVPVDGVCGPMTILAVSTASPPQKPVNSIACQRITLHASRVSVDPTQLRFLQGWLNRALQFIE
jgi:lysozyme family protein